MVAGVSWLLPAMDDRKTVSANVISSQELLYMVALLVLAALIGGFIRQSQAQAELHGLLQRQRENLEIAHALHDYISNDITDASLLLGQAQEGVSLALQTRCSASMMLRRVRMSLLRDLNLRNFPKSRRTTRYRTPQFQNVLRPPFLVRSCLMNYGRP